MMSFEESSDEYFDATLSDNDPVLQLTYDDSELSTSIDIYEETSHVNYLDMESYNTNQETKINNTSTYHSSHDVRQPAYENSSYKSKNLKTRSKSATHLTTKVDSGFQSSIPGPIKFSEQTYAERQDEERRKMEAEDILSANTESNDYLYMSTHIRSPSPEKYQKYERKVTSSTTVVPRQNDSSDEQSLPIFAKCSITVDSVTQAQPVNGIQVSENSRADSPFSFRSRKAKFESRGKSALVSSEVTTSVSSPNRWNEPVNTPRQYESSTINNPVGTSYNDLYSSRICDKRTDKTVTSPRRKTSSMPRYEFGTSYLEKDLVSPSNASKDRSVNSSNVSVDHREATNERCDHVASPRIYAQKICKQSRTANNSSANNVGSMVSNYESQDQDMSHLEFYRFKAAGALHSRSKSTGELFQAEKTIKSQRDIQDQESCYQAAGERTLSNIASPVYFDKIVTQSTDAIYRKPETNGVYRDILSPVHFEVIEKPWDYGSLMSNSSSTITVCKPEARSDQEMRTTYKKSEHMKVPSPERHPTTKSFTNSPSVSDQSYNYSTLPKQNKKVPNSYINSYTAQQSRSQSAGTTRNLRSEKFRNTSDTESHRRVVSPPARGYVRAMADEGRFTDRGYYINSDQRLLNTFFGQQTESPVRSNLEERKEMSVSSKCIRTNPHVYRDRVSTKDHMWQSSAHRNIENYVRNQADFSACSSPRSRSFSPCKLPAYQTNILKQSTSKERRAVVSPEQSQYRSDCLSPKVTISSIDDVSIDFSRDASPVKTSSEISYQKLIRSTSPIPYKQLKNQSNYSRVDYAHSPSREPQFSPKPEKHLNVLRPRDPNVQKTTRKTTITPPRNISAKINCSHNFPGRGRLIQERKNKYLQSLQDDKYFPTRR